MRDPVTIIEIDTKLLEECDTSHVIRLFFKETTIENAKLLGGTISLAFPKYDFDTRPNCIIPEIRDFIQKLHGVEPRFPFYYVDDKMRSMHLQHLACLSPIENIKLLKKGREFGLEADPQLKMNYLTNIIYFMQQLDYSEPEIEKRIKKVADGLSLHL